MTTASTLTHDNDRTHADTRPVGTGDPVPGGIVVGVDGSTNSVDALQWALDEGQLRGVAVHVVMT